MKRPEVKKLYHEAWNKWGMELQFVMLMEECSELIKASSKVLRKHKEDVNVWRNFAEEVADVEIMIDQIKTMCDWQLIDKAVENRKHDKLLRLNKMLDNPLGFKLL